MGLFKNVFKGAAEKLKDSLEESGINVRDRLDDMRNGLDGIKQKATNANNTISSADTSEDDNKDEGIKIPVGTVTNGVLEIDEGFSELDSESLEEYKHLRKIIMPASLEQLDSDVINDMKELKEVDFSKVTRLKEIPEEFIYGETSIVRFIIPQGVKEVGNGFLGDTQTIKEVCVPSTVKSLGYITGQSENNIDVYLFASDTDIDEVQEDIKNLYVLPQYFVSYARKLKKCGSEASLREIPNDKKNIYPEEMPIAIETTTEEPPADVSLGNPQEIKSKGAGVFSPRLEALIDAALQDGVLTDKERFMIKSRAEKEGEDWDEVEMIIEARLAKMQPEVTIAQTPQALNQPATPVPQKETKDQINELLEFRRKKLVDLRIVQDEKEKHKTPENVNRWEQIIREIQGIDATIKNLRKAAEEKAAAEKTVSPPPIPVPPTPPVSTKKVSVPPPIPIGVSQKTIATLKTTSLEETKQAQMKLWWVKDLELLYNGDKYALKYTGDKKKTTDYVYDDVAMLNEYQARLTQKQTDGSMLYGVACTCGWNFLLTNCEYSKVTFLDGIGAVLAIDEDGDEYAIDRWGKPYALEIYREKVEEDMNNE